MPRNGISPNGKSPYLKTLAFEYVKNQFTIDKNQPVSEDELQQFIKSLEDQMICYYLSNEGQQKENNPARYYELKADLGIADGISRHRECELYKDEISLLLKLNYLYWQQSSTGQKLNIAIRITIDINECSTGFHMRLSELLDDQSSTHSLLHSLKKYREKIIRSFVARKYSSGSHTLNCYKHIAGAMELGLRRGITNDPRLKDIIINRGRENIIKEISDVMLEQYEPVRILSNVFDDLLAFLHVLGYQGTKTDGSHYNKETYDAWTKGIVRFLGMDKNQKESLNFRDLFLLEDEILVVGMNKSYLKYFVFEILTTKLFSFSYDQKQALNALFCPESNFSIEQLKILCRSVTDETTNQKTKPIIRNPMDCIALIKAMEKSDDGKACKQSKLANGYATLLFNARGDTKENTLRTVNFLDMLSRHCGEKPFTRKMLSEYKFDLFTNFKLNYFKKQSASTENQAQSSNNQPKSYINRPESFKKLLNLLLVYKKPENEKMMRLLERYINLHRTIDKITLIKGILELDVIQKNEDISNGLKKIANDLFKQILRADRPKNLMKLPHPEQCPEFYDLMDNSLSQEVLAASFASIDTENNHLLTYICCHYPDTLKSVVRLFQKLIEEQKEQLLVHYNKDNKQLIDLLLENKIYLPFYLPLIEIIDKHQPDAETRLAMLLIIPDEKGQNRLINAIQTEDAEKSETLIKIIQRQPISTRTELLLCMNDNGHALQLALTKKDALWISHIFSIMKSINPELQMHIFDHCDQETLLDCLHAFPELTRDYLSMIGGFDVLYQPRYEALLPDKMASAEENLGIRILFENVSRKNVKICNDKEQMLTAVREINGRMYAFASNLLKKDIELLIAAIRENPEAIHFALEGLKNLDDFKNLAHIKNKKERQEACDELEQKLKQFDAYQPIGICLTQQLIDENDSTSPKKASWLYPTFYARDEQSTIRKQAAQKLIQVFEGKNPDINVLEKKVLKSPEFSVIWENHPKTKEKMEMLFAKSQVRNNYNQLTVSLNLSSSDEDPIDVASSSACSTGPGFG